MRKRLEMMHELQTQYNGNKLKLKKLKNENKRLEEYTFFDSEEVREKIEAEKYNLQIKIRAILVKQSNLLNKRENLISS